MTLFDSLFLAPYARDRHNKAPLVRERASQQFSRLAFSKAAERYLESRKLELAPRSLKKETQLLVTVRIFRRNSNSPHYVRAVAELQRTTRPESWLCIYKHGNGCCAQDLEASKAVAFRRGVFEAITVTVRSSRFKSRQRSRTFSPTAVSELRRRTAAIACFPSVRESDLLESLDY